MARTDLNLLVIFDCIMQEQSVSAAARQLAMTQPAVSNAVSRMRHQWRDPLFIKDGRGIRPTPAAERLWAQIHQPLEVISSALNEQDFDPASASDTLRIAMTDGTAAFIWPRLRARTEQLAPLLNLHAVPFRGDGMTQLLDADADLVFDYFAGSHRQVHQQRMFHNHFVCVMSASDALAQQPLTEEVFLQAEHLLVSLSGDARGQVDTQLAARGQSRRIAMTVNSFASALMLLPATQLLCTLPWPVVAATVRSGQLVAKQTPLAIPPVPISMAWHQRNHQRPLQRWLRAQLQEIVDLNPEQFIPPQSVS